MILNRIDPGTACTVRETGETGTVKKIYFYPTKFEIEFPDGHVGHYSSNDIEFDGIKQERATLQLPPVPVDGIGECWSDWKPFKGESIVKPILQPPKILCGRCLHLWKCTTYGSMGSSGHYLMLTPRDTYTVIIFLSLI